MTTRRRSRVALAVVLAAVAIATATATAAQQRAPGRSFMWKAARQQGVRGGAVTPFLLAAVERATQGRSLAANLALLERNAALAADVAVALAVAVQAAA